MDKTTAIDAVTNTAPTGTEATAASDENTSTKAPGTTEDNAQEAKTFDAAYVAVLRQEAAKWRTAAQGHKEAVDKMREQFTEASAKLKEAESAKHELARVKAAVAAGIDPQLATRLQGNTPDELAADAQQFKGLLGGTDLGQSGRDLDSKSSTKNRLLRD